VKPAREQNVRHTIHHLSGAQLASGSYPRDRVWHATRGNNRQQNVSAEILPRLPLQRDRKISRRKLERLQHPRPSDQPRDRTHTRVTGPQFSSTSWPTSIAVAHSPILLSQQSDSARSPDGLSRYAIPSASRALSGPRSTQSFASKAGIALFSKWSLRNTGPLFSLIITSPKVR
jgi:hypothetical protein